MSNSPFNKRIACIDIDDTIGNLRVPVEKMLKKESGIDVSCKDWHALSAELHYNISEDRFFEMLLEQDILQKMKPHPETRKFLEYIKSAGGIVMMVTARRWHPDAKNITENWLNQYNLPYDLLSIVDLKSDKRMVVEGYNPIFTVDDSIKHCLSYAKCDTIDNVYAYSMPWNTRKKDDLLEHGVKFIDNLWQIRDDIEGVLPS